MTGAALGISRVLREICLQQLVSYVGHRPAARPQKGAPCGGFGEHHAAPVRAEARTCWEQEEIQTRILEEMCRVIPGKAAGVYLLRAVPQRPPGDPASRPG